MPEKYVATRNSTIFFCNILLLHFLLSMQHLPGRLPAQSNLFFVQPPPQGRAMDSQARRGAAIIEIFFLQHPLQCFLLELG